MAEILDTKEEFTLLRHARSFAYAGRGLVVFFRSTPNAWLQGVGAIAVVALGVYFTINTVEWALLVFAIGLVFVAEAINTALEIDINLTSPDYHPYAKDTKDVAAGAVLIASITAALVGLLVFIPYLW